MLLAESCELALAEGRRGDALSLVREGIEASRETGPGFAGPMLFGLLSLIEPSRQPQDDAFATGETLLAKGAVGHNHFCFRRYAIEHALLSGRWELAEHHARALLARMAAEPLPYSDLIARRGRALARIGRGDATDVDDKDLAKVRAEAAALDFRLDALGQALRGH